MMKAQTYFGINYMPGIATNLPINGSNFVFTNIGATLGTNFPSSNMGFEGGVYFFNRGSGGRVGVFDQNNAFVRWEWNSENAYHLHIPVSLKLKQDNFYLKGGLCVDKFLFYKQKRAGILISEVPPIWADNLRFGLHIDGGVIIDLEDLGSLEGGLYISNTFAGNSATPISFLNMGVSLSFNINLSEDDSIDEDELEDY